MKTMKKLSLCVLVLMLVCVAVFGFAACDKNKVEECQHDWGNWEIVEESTCVEAGSQMRVCKLDPSHTETAELPLAEHTFTEYESNGDATCTKDGTKVATCDVEGCDATHVTVDFDSILDHSYDQKEATEAYLATPADCFNKATYYYSCECGAKGTKTFTSGDYRHVFSDEIAFDEESHWYPCVCEDEDCDCDERLEETPHEWDEGIVANEPTCTELGIIHYTCACGAEKNETIPVRHDLTHTAKTNATCEAIGNIEYWYCTECERYFSDANAENEIEDLSTLSIPKTAHDFEGGKWIFTEDAHVKECAVCKATDDANAAAHELVPASTLTEHWLGCECGYKEQVQKHVLTLKKDSTYHWFECTSCGFVGEKHSHEEAVGATHIYYQPSTCTENGYATYKCATCDTSFNKPVPASHGTLKHFVATEANCTDSGNIEYWQCQTCKKYYSDSAATNEILLKDINIAALGHDFDGGDFKRDDTYHWVKCSRCDETANKEKHTTEKRYNETHHYTVCTVCNHESNFNEHSGRTMPITQPTCVTEGSGTKTCSCGYVWTVSIPVIPHDLVLVNAKASTCTEHGNIAYWQCADCKKCFSYNDSKHEISLEETLTPMHDFANGIYTYTATAHAKVCANCDAVSEYTTHSFTKADRNDERHWKECVCGCRSEDAPHSFASVREDDYTHSLVCSCGETIRGIEHSFTAVYVDESTHAHECECGCVIRENSGMTLEHTFDSHYYTCSHGYATEKVSHDFTVKKIDESTHVHVCSCGFTSNVITGALTKNFNDEEHWESCDCGYRASVEAHSIVMKYESLTEHWHECACGYKSDVIDGTVSIKSNATAHWGECSCKHKHKSEPQDHKFENKFDKNNHWKECTICGASVSVEAHNLNAIYVDDMHHTHECACGYKSDLVKGILVTKHDDAKHWMECRCGFKVKDSDAAHSFTTKFDGENHWEECACGYQKNSAAHTYTATYFSETQHKHLCSCGFTSDAIDGALAVKYDANNHWNECNCGYTEGITAHSFNIEKVDDSQHCFKCGDCAYSTTPVNHEYIPEIIDATQHIHVCACGHETAPIIGTVETKWNNVQHWKECNCGEKRDFVNHSSAMKHDGTQHWSECDCGYTEGITPHTLTLKHDGGDEHWLGCSCGYTEAPAAHSFVKTYDEYGHWLECACGAKKDYAAHTLNADRDDASHWLECDCGHTEGSAAHTFSGNYNINSHWEECSCGYKINDASHTFTEKSDDFNHWLECACGCVANKEEHELKVTNDDNAHWLECKCGHTEGSAAHTLGFNHENGGEHWLECECGFKQDSVEHKFDTKFDEKEHWLECACGYKKNSATHSLSGNLGIDIYTGIFLHWHSCECGFESELTPVYITLDENADFNGDTHLLKLGYNESSHWFECIFEYKATVEDHSFSVKFDENGHWLECICGYTKDYVAHSYKAAFDGREHWEECEDCGARKNIQNHNITLNSIDDAQHNESCACGYSAVVSHEFKLTANDEFTHSDKCKCGYTSANNSDHNYINRSNETHHWEECLDCAYVNNYSEHIGGSTDKNDDEHWQVCTCGAKLNVSAHKFNATFVDEHHHELECACGYNGGLVNHDANPVYNNETHHYICDCGHATVDEEHKLEISYDENGHWTKCDCGYATEAEAHVYKLVTDEFTHAFVCSCGHHDVAPTVHTWDDGVVKVLATCKTNGEVVYTCTECGATKTVKVNASASEAHTTLKYVPGYDAKCTKPGRIEYWYCPDCGNYFSDAEATVMVSLEDTYIYLDHDFENGAWVHNADGKRHAKECANCGARSAWTNHVIEKYYNDGDSHYIGCECGFVKEGTAEEHSFGEYAYDSDYHYFSCNGCGCNEYEKHTLVYMFDDTYHWYVCECGYESDKLLHSHSLSFDDSLHFELCECGHTKNAANHEISFTVAPASHTAECACGYSVTVSHEFEFKFNASEHWYECECGLTTMHGNHYMNTVSDDDFYWTECECGHQTGKIEKETK